MRCLWCANPEGFDLNSAEAADYSIIELIDEVKRSSLLFTDGGGVTLTGGEPTIQFDEVSEFLKRLKEMGIHTAIETNGTHKNLTQLLPYIDYLIVDFKHPNSEIHGKWTGIGNEVVIENLLKLFSLNREFLIRIPLINGFNAEVAPFVEFFKCFDVSNVTFEFLSYHEYGKNKWQTEYKVTNGFVGENTMNEFTKQFKNNGFKVVKH